VIVTIARRRTYSVFTLRVANLVDYHSLRDAHGNESNNFSVATFGQ